jgi:hypothetical protein
MRPPNDVWQGCAGYWQSAFIRENLLSLGHAAWQGYLTQGRGVVVCDVAAIAASSMDWRSDGVPYRVHYLPAATVSSYLEAQRCVEAVIHRLMDTVQTYQPERDILMAIAGAGSLEIQWLQNLAIPPPTVINRCGIAGKNLRWTRAPTRSIPVKGRRVNSGPSAQRQPIALRAWRRSWVPTSVPM